MSKSIRIDGLEKAIKTVNKAIEKVDDNTLEALEKIGLNLLGESAPLAPVDKGDLRGSGFSEMDGHTVVVGYTEPYALRQHEETGYNHPRGGQAKYLEEPLKRNVEKYVNKIIQAIRKGVE